MRTLLLILLAAVSATTLSAQMVIIPQSRLDSIASPKSVVSRVAVSSDRVDFGRIEEQKTAKNTICLQNGESKSVVITKLSTSCRCVTATASERVVGSGKSAQIALTFNPKGFPGPFEHKVFVYTNLSETLPTAVVALRGYVVADADRSCDYPYHCAGLLLRSGGVKFNHSKVERIACLNGSSRAIKVAKDCLLSSPQLSVHSEPETLKPGQAGDIVVTLKGEASGNLKLYLEADLAPRAREIKIE